LGKYSADLSIVLMVTEKVIRWVARMVYVMDAQLVELMAYKMDDSMVEQLAEKKDTERVLL